ncbi:unnamed protein product [Rotaria sp. Silwood1]|nr:unnamed protein product [Rotaria sp. Silwood1]
MALLIASIFQLPIDHIERDQNIGIDTNVQRPNNAALDSSKLSNEFSIHINQVKFETTIKQCLQPFI